MFTKQTSFLKFTCASSILTFVAACAQPQPVPIVADMYFDKFSAAQSASNGIDFCELKVEDFTPELVAQIRSNPNYERNLAIWLEECPELALAFADFGTASIAGTVSASPFSGEGLVGGFAGISTGETSGEQATDPTSSDPTTVDQTPPDVNVDKTPPDDNITPPDDNKDTTPTNDPECACDDAPDDGISFG